MVKVSMQWGGGVKFHGTSTFGHKITTDIAKDKGGDETGYRPTELLLYALAGCTGIDVVRIMEKKRTPLQSLEIQVVGHEHEAGYPHYFEKIEITYIARGENIDLDKLNQAIALSEEKYCSVSGTLKREVVIETLGELRID